MTDTNQLLTAINMRKDDRLILIKEHDLADSNFILTHLMKQILDEPNNNLCLVILHNTLGHYSNVGKKIGYDLMAAIKSGRIVTLEPMTDIFNELANNAFTDYLQEKRELIMIKLMNDIFTKIDALRAKNASTYLIIDDLSHLSDLGISYRLINRFLTVFMQTVCADVHVIINMHIGDDIDDKISTSMEYVSDIRMDVAPLRTGRSQTVSGVLTIAVPSEDINKTFHFKTLDNEIRMFKPGEAVHYLYQ